MSSSPDAHDEEVNDETLPIHDIVAPGINPDVIGEAGVFFEQNRMVQDYMLRSNDLVSPVRRLSL